MKNQTHNSSYEEISFISPIPKIIHRIWLTFRSDFTEMPKKYQENDKILKSLHRDWDFWEWNDSTTLNFINNYYPDFLSTYISYDSQIMRHDSARYLILKQFGGVFIQHSFVFNKSINPLLKNYDLIFSRKFNQSDPLFYDRKLEVANGFIASIPNHPFWENITEKLKDVLVKPLAAKVNSVMSYTGPIFLTKLIQNFTEENPINNIRVLDRKYLLPFYKNEKEELLIKENCIINDNTQDCFNIFNESFAYTPWNADWTKKEYMSQSIDISNLLIEKSKALYDKIFVTFFGLSAKRWSKIAKTLYDNNIIFEPFLAVNGYSTPITLTDNKTIIHGIDIKHNAYQLEKNVEYKIDCNNNAQPSKTIYLQANISNLMAANIGTCCTKVLIREEIIRNHYNNTIIFEDDFEPNTNNLLTNINNFIANLPKYDIAYLNNAIPQKLKLKSLNNFLYSRGEAVKWYGDWAYMLSYEGAKTLNGDYHLINPSDEYARGLATGEIRKDGLESFDAFFAKHKFSILNYNSYTGHSPNSLASTMGCREKHKISYKLCNQSLYLTQSFVENLSESDLTQVSREFIKQNFSLSNFITDLNGEIGQEEIQENNNNTKVEKLYLITCEPKKLNSLEYLYNGEINNIVKIKNWCSHLMLINYIKFREENSAIFDNNVKFLPNANSSIHNYISTMSKSFDLLFLNSNINESNCRKLGLNIFFSLKAIDKILSNVRYRDEVVDFYCDIYKQNYSSNNGEFEIYQLDTNIFAD